MNAPLVFQSIVISAKWVLLQKMPIEFIKLKNTLMVGLKAKRYAHTVTIKSRVLTLWSNTLIIRFHIISFPIWNYKRKWHLFDFEWDRVHSKVAITKAILLFIFVVMDRPSTKFGNLIFIFFEMTEVEFIFYKFWLSF